MLPYFLKSLSLIIEKYNIMYLCCKFFINFVFFFGNYGLCHVVEIICC